MDTLFADPSGMNLFQSRQDMLRSEYGNTGAGLSVRNPKLEENTGNTMAFLGGYNPAIPSRGSLGVPEFSPQSATSAGDYGVSFEGGKAPRPTSDPMGNMEQLSYITSTLQNFKTDQSQSGGAQVGQLAGAGIGTAVGFSMGGPVGAVLGSSLGAMAGSTAGGLLDWWMGAGDRERERREARKRQEEANTLRQIAMQQMRRQEQRAEADWQFSDEGRRMQRAHQIMATVKDVAMQKAMKRGVFLQGRPAQQPQTPQIGLF